MPAIEEMLPDIGFLSDAQIAQAVEGGFLLDNGTYDRDGLRHASYTLRLGGRVEIARSAATATSDNKEFVVTRLQAGSRIDVRPGDTALLYSLEHIRLPTCVLGFTVARGLLYAEALAPENTYVDPGFTGQLYTTVTNVSNRVVYLEFGMPIARIFFFRLAQPATNGYRSGSAMGIAQQLSSVRAVALATADQCRTATTADLLSVVHAIPMGGMHLVELLRRQSLFYRRLLILSVAFPVLLILANQNTWVRENVGSFAANVAAGLVATALTLLIPKFLPWIGWAR